MVVHWNCVNFPCLSDLFSSGKMNFPLALCHLSAGGFGLWWLFPPPFFTFSSHSSDKSHRRTTADFPGFSGGGYSGSGLTAGGVRRLRPRLKAMQGGQGSSIDGRAGQGGGAGRCKSFTDGLRLQGQHQSIGRLPFRFPFFRSLSSKIGEEFPISFYIFLEKKEINFKIFVLFAVGKSIRIFGKIW